jgi:hypothetical protein
VAGESTKTDGRISVGFDDFGWEELNAAADARGLPVERYLRQAVARFIDTLPAGGRTALSREVPDIARRPVDKPFEVVVELSGEQHSAMAQEAARQEITLAELAEHALLLGLSEQDRKPSGKRRGLAVRRPGDRPRASFAVAGPDAALMLYGLAFCAQVS